MCQCCKHLFCLDDAHAANLSPSGIGAAEMRNARYVAKAECRYCVRARGCRRSRSQTNGHVITTTHARASQSAPYATLRTGVFFHPVSNADMKLALLAEYGGQPASPRSQVPAVHGATTRSRTAADAADAADRRKAARPVQTQTEQGDSQGESLELADDGAVETAKAAEDQMSESGSGGASAAFAPEQLPVIELVGPRARRVSPRRPKTGFV